MKKRIALVSPCNVSKDISIRIESHPLDINTYPGPTGPVTESKAHKSIDRKNNAEQHLESTGGLFPLGRKHRKKDPPYTW